GLIIWKKAWRFLAGVLCVASLMYMLLFGVNYYRVPLPGPEPFDDAYLTSVCIDLADKMSAARALTKEDANGCMVLSQSKWETVRMMGGAKPVLASHWWSYTGIAGMYFPFFAEANVNIDMPDCDIPATTAHELAHVYGRALEDEANFLAYMNTRDDTRADIRYSGLMLAYIYCSNALYETNQDLYNQVAAHVSAGVWRDFAQRSAYWKQFEGPVQDASTGVNNAFITGQGDANGVRSYDRVVLLIVGQYQREGFEG
ncbi:MAG: DUF3810 domain-containing protein, partial [Oscillospiraceae bacterium]|nr:DUF3810 domain-containing protein [Oscillospiraceae bacterium]